MSCRVVSVYMHVEREKVFLSFRSSVVAFVVFVSVRFFQYFYHEHHHIMQPNLILKIYVRANSVSLCHSIY